MTLSASSQTFIRRMQRIGHSQSDFNLIFLHIQPVDEYAEHFVRCIIQLRNITFPLYGFAIECRIEEGGVIAYEILADFEALRVSFWGSNMDLDDGLWVSWEKSAVKQNSAG
jgi:hypothetical protein